MPTEKEKNIKNVSRTVHPTARRYISFEECYADVTDIKGLVCGIELLLSSGDPDLIAKFIIARYGSENRLTPSEKTEKMPTDGK